MRKITSRHKEDKKKKRNQIIAGVILVVIMFLSVVGYSFQGQEDESIKKIIYNGFEFVNQNNLWMLNIENYYFAFKHNPNQVEKIYSPVNYLESYSNKPLYIFSEDRNARMEIYRNLDPRANAIVQRIQSACYNEEECLNEEDPIKTCENNFIIIRERNKTQIRQEENCVFIEGPKANLTKITNEFLFKVLRIEQ